MSSPMDLAPRLQENVGRVLLGKDGAVQLAITALLADGHLLIEDKPGVGKTLMARALARSLDLPFQRVQCTADLLPTDVIGTLVYHQASGEITFRHGPVFTSILVADELNRTPPRTQSALLECMQERRVTIERRSYDLDDPFFVIATQNPLTFSGTYPLPESQLDRFLLRIRIGYPDEADEARILRQEDGHRAIEGLEPVADAAALRAAREVVRQVRVDDSLVAYMVALARHTRRHGEVQLGVSSRGGQALHRACRARAVVRGRDYAIPDDVRALAVPVFAHRLTVRGGSEAAEAIMLETVNSVPTPD